MTAAASTPVPDLAIQVNGESYGGQYWNQEELTVRATVSPDGSIDITAETTLGHIIARETLTRDRAEHIRDTLADGTQTALPGGLTSQIHWQLRGDDRYSVDLHRELEEIGEWLAYATGAKQWDPADTDWEY